MKPVAEFIKARQLPDQLERAAQHPQELRLIAREVVGRQHDLVREVADPRAVDACHLRGVLRNQQGRAAEAVPFFEAALKAQLPNVALAFAGTQQTWNINQTSIPSQAGQLNTSVGGGATTASDRAAKDRNDAS